MKLNPETLARASSRHPWRTSGSGLVIFVAGSVGAAAPRPASLTTDFDFTNNPEAMRAQDAARRRRSSRSGSTTETFVCVGLGDGRRSAFPAR